MYGLPREKRKAKKKNNAYYASLYCIGRTKKIKKSLDRKFGKTAPYPKMTSSWDFI